MLAAPGWASGSQAAAATNQYRDARDAARFGDARMAAVARLAGSQLGAGSHSYRIGGPGEHSADRRLTALKALSEQRRKKWWHKGPLEPAKLNS